MVISDLLEVREAREYIRGLCARHRLGSDACDIVTLLTSEVVTNALRHGRSEARVTATVSGQTVHVEVSDDDPRHPQMVGAGENALDGRGLMIVERLANAWGVQDDEHGKTVWFNVACSAT